MCTLRIGTHAAVAGLSRLAEVTGVEPAPGTSSDELIYFWGALPSENQVEVISEN